MPIDISWYVSSRIIHLHVYDVADIEQIEQLASVAGNYLQDGIAPIHVLLDDSTAQPPPLSLKQLKMALPLKLSDTEKLGWVVGIGEVNIIAKMVLPMLMNMLGIKYVRVATIDEALALLQKQDKSLKFASIKSTVE